MCPPPKPTYVADGTGRDTYIRRDPVEQHGKHLYKEDPRLITRFGAAGSVLTRDRHSGHAGFHPGERDNSVGGPNGVAERPARFLRTPSQTFPVQITKFSTMKELTLDAFCKPPAAGPRSSHHSQLPGFCGFVPMGPIAADLEASKWLDLVLDREGLMRAMFAAMDFNSDGVLSMDEVAKITTAFGFDPESDAVKDAVATADFSGLGGGGDGTITVEEHIIFMLERTAAMSDEEFEIMVKKAMDTLAAAKQ